jgi:[citrate (pro-3S)-lyase] ligase
VFGGNIAPALHITKRFVGTEPNCGLTNQYNLSMQKVLPKYGIELVEIPRIESGETAISASRVRAALAEGTDPAELEPLLPPATLAYLKSERGAEVIAKLKK